MPILTIGEYRDAKETAKGFVREQQVDFSSGEAKSLAFDDATRWDMREEFLADSRPDANTTNDKGVAPTLLSTNKYYGTDIATQYGQFQRSLCNKCHLQD